MPSTPDSLIQGLKARKLVPWVLGYAASAWALLQGIDLMGDHFGWPQMVFRVATVCAAAGVLLVLVLAWFHGARGHQRGGVVEFVLLASIVAVAGLGVALTYRSTPPEAGRSGVAPALAADANDRSVAVLPFVNMSDDPENEYFSDGITEEILNALAQVPGLKVAARTSAFSFKHKDLPINEIARQLGVRHVLEGSVRKDGRTLRITAQLIKAEDGYHVWSQVYDREMKDVFKVQEEIARSITEALRVKLAGERVRPLAERRTEDEKAYELYLKGRFFWAKRGAASLARSVEYFREAITRDPKFAAAHAALAMAYAAQPYYSAIPADSVTTLALASARHALALDSLLGDGHLALAFTLTARLQLTEAESSYERALALTPPTDPNPHHWHGLNLDALGRIDEALAEKRRAAALDPLSALMATNVALTLIYARQFNESIAANRAATELDSTFTRGYFNLARASIFAGLPDSAVHALEKAASLGPAIRGARGLLAFAHAAAGRWTEADRVRAEIMQAGATAPNADIAAAEIAFGNRAAAIAAIEHGLARHEFLSAFGSPGCDPVFDPLKTEPHFLALLQRYGMRACPASTPWPIKPRPR